LTKPWFKPNSFVVSSISLCGDYCNLTLLWYVLSPIQVLRPTIVWEAIFCCNVSRKSMHEVHFTHPTNCMHLWSMKQLWTKQFPLQLLSISPITCVIGFIHVC
jgi:hypothetical protein